MNFSIDILISTMDRDNLGFLEIMMQDNDMDDFNFIIINQTNPKKLLKCEKSNIKIINSFNRGSPRSRNTAILKSKADISLLADDDIIYLPGLKRTISQAYIEYGDADLITFEAMDFNGNPYANYFSSGEHNKSTLRSICTIGITFKPEILVEKKIFFNHFFGVGSEFKGATEYVFLRNAMAEGLKMYHKATSIVKHPVISSGKLMGSDNAFFAKSAMITRFYGNLSYIWLLKYALSMWKNKYIEFKELPHKLRQGLAGIKRYKQLVELGEIEKIYVD